MEVIIFFIIDKKEKVGIHFSAKPRDTNLPPTTPLKYSTPLRLQRVATCQFANLPIR